MLSNVKSKTHLSQTLLHDDPNNITNNGLHCDVQTPSQSSTLVQYCTQLLINSELLHNMWSGVQGKITCNVNVKRFMSVSVLEVCHCDWLAL